MLRNALVFSGLTLALVCSAAAQDPEPGLAEHLAPFFHPLEIKDGKLSGPGGELLRDRAAASHFLMVGEQHATAEIPRLITALYRSVEPLGYSYAAIEVGPLGTRHLEALLRDPEPGALESYFARDENLLTIPFYFFREEAEFVRAVIAGSDAPGPVLWGLDQEFVAGGRIALERLAELAGSEAEEKAVAAAQTAAAENPMYLGAAPASDLEALEEAFASSASPEARRIVRELAMTNRIYGPFMRREGSVYLANRERERFMKAGFLRHWEEARSRSGSPPRVFLKFGANHLFRGLSPTHVLSLGNFVIEHAEAEGLEAYSLHVDCLGGELRAAQTGEAVPCTSYFLGEDSALGAALTDGGPFLVDLEGLRTRREILELLDDTSRDLVWAFDGYIGVANTTAATFFEGRFPDFGG